MEPDYNDTMKIWRKSVKMWGSFDVYPLVKINIPNRDNDLSTTFFSPFLPKHANSFFEHQNL